MSDSGPANGTTPRALIIGGSMAGLFTALLLRRGGWRVAVFERSRDELASRGAGIATHPELLAALDEAGVGSQGIGVEVDGRMTLAVDGSVAGLHDLKQVTTSWDVLYQRLRDGLPPDTVRAGMPLERVLAHDGRAVARFADGSEEAGDLLIGADGVRSTVRAQLLPEARPLYAGYVAWRGMVREEEASPATRETFSHRITFTLTPGEQFLTYPVAGEGGALALGERRINWVWYRQAGSEPEFEALFTDPDGRRHDVSMPPNRMNPVVVEAMRRDADRRLPPQAREVIALTPKPFLQAIYDLESPEIVFGRVAILGDAAFVARPHTGFGVTKAAGDAVSLARALAAAAGDIDAGLARFRAERLPFGKRMVERGRQLGRFLDAVEDPFGTARSVDESVMEEVAISDTMRPRAAR